MDNNQLESQLKALIAEFSAFKSQSEQKEQRHQQQIASITQHVQSLELKLAQASQAVESDLEVDLVQEVDLAPEKSGIAIEVSSNSETKSNPQAKEPAIAQSKSEADQDTRDIAALSLTEPSEPQVLESKPNTQTQNEFASTTQPVNPVEQSTQQAHTKRYQFLESDQFERTHASQNEESTAKLDPPLAQDSTKTETGTENETDQRQIERPQWMSDLWQNTVALFALILNPLFGAFEKGLTTYQHYQRQGKAPVFLMTVAGILALVFGFGYLLQYSFTHLLNDSLKAGLGFVASLTVVGLGCRLYIKKTDSQEYASSIIAMGLIFGYMSCYFLGPYYQVVGAQVSFILFCLVTALSYSLALWFDTKVVAALTLLGGVLTPYISGSVEAVDASFTLYLVLLAMVNLHLARKINWPILGQLTFFTILGVFEFSRVIDGKTLIGQSQLIGHSVSIQALFWVFLGYFSFNGLALKTSISRIDLTIISTNIFYLLYAWFSVSSASAFEAPLFSSTEFSTSLLADQSLSTPLSTIMFGVILLVDALLLTAVTFKLKILDSKQGALYALMISLLVAFGVGIMLPLNLSMAVWSAEVLALLFVGVRYHDSAIRLEGIIAFVISLVVIAASTLSILIDDFYLTHPDFWLNIAVMGIELFVAHKLLFVSVAHQNNQASSPSDLSNTLLFKVERFVSTLSVEAFTVWGIVTIFCFIYGLQNIIGIHSLWFIAATVSCLWAYYRFVRNSNSATAAQQNVDTIASKNRSYSNFSAYLSFLALAGILFFGVQYFGSQGSSLIVLQTLNTQLAFSIFLVFCWAYLPVAQRWSTNHPAFALINQLRTLSYLSLVALTINLLINLLASLGRTLPHSLYQELALVSVAFGIAYLLLRKPKSVKRDITIRQESFSLFLTGGIFALVAQFGIEYALVAGIIPMAYLLRRSILKQLPISLGLSWLYFALPVIAIFIGAIEVSSLRFTLQPWYAKLAYVELFVMAWGVQFIYEKCHATANGFKFARIMRTISYLAIPIFFLPTVARRLPEYLPLAFAVSTTLACALVLWKKTKPFKVEFAILFCFSVLGLFFNAVNALTNGGSLANLINLLGASALYAGIVTYTLYNARKTKQSLFGQGMDIFHFVIVHFYAFAVGYLSYAMTAHVGFSILMIAIYYMLLFAKYTDSQLVEKQQRIVAMMGFGLLFIPILQHFLAALVDSGKANSNPVEWADFAVILASSCLITLALYVLVPSSKDKTKANEKSILSDGQTKFADYVYHAIVAMSYVGIAAIVAGLWYNVAISVMMVLHAITILFLTFKPSFRHLVKLSGLLYAAAGFKVIFHDMADLGLVHKVVALMVIGALLLAAAFQFEKMKGNAKTEDSSDSE